MAKVKANTLFSMVTSSLVCLYGLLAIQHALPLAVNLLKRKQCTAGQAEAFELQKKVAQIFYVSIKMRID